MHRDVIEALLCQDLSGNLLPLGHLAESGLRAGPEASWLGAWSGSARAGRARLLGGVLRVGAHPGGWAAATPFGEVEAVEALGAAMVGRSIELILAPRAPADALWRGLGRPAPKLWSDHLLAVCTRVSEGPRLPLRLARLAELDAVADMAAELEREDMGDDPRLSDPELHRETVARKIQHGQIWLGERDGAVVFKGDVGLSFSRGALVGSLWVSPARRGEGLGAAGVRALCDRLLQATPRVGLHVAEGNLAARAAYRRAGFEEAGPFRLFLGPAPAQPR